MVCLMNAGQATEIRAKLCNFIKKKTKGMTNIYWKKKGELKNIILYLYKQ